MALPLHDHCSRTPQRRRSPRPPLVVIEGGRRSSGEVRPSPALRRPTPVGTRSVRSSTAAIYRRRRLTTAVIAAGLCVAVSLGAARFDGAGAGSAPVPDVVVQVRSGDTLWSIARSLDTGRDVRSVVAELAAANGGEVDLEAGQDLVVPGSLAAHLSRR